MIVVKLIGGLGNQMFQYAFAKYLSVKNGVQLKLDVSQLNSKLDENKFIIRDLGLLHFNTKLVIANDSEIKGYRKSKFYKVLDLFYLNLPFSVNKLYVKEPFFRFYKTALNAPKDCYLDGYWQCEKYFIDVRNSLLNDFSFVSELSTETIRLAEQIKVEQSVSIHVRRGDYVSIQENKNLYATCDENYYLAAMKKIVEMDKEVVFYVFSDEPEWFKTNVDSSKFNLHFVTHNSGKNSYQDLYLMSLCKHNIIANSSFSWWGAWLNQNAKKVVIAPKRWFNDSIKDTRDLIPKDWIQL